MTPAAEVAREVKKSASRILVAEDSSITQDLLKLVLGQRGYVVDTAETGPEALEALKSGDYDVALLDFHLPGMDGVEIVSAYRRDMPGPGPRFIAVTADVEGLLSHKDNCELFDEIVPKPVDIGEVCRVIESKEAPGGETPLSSEPPVDGVKPSPAVAPPPVDTSFAQNFDFLSWPDDFGSDHVAAKIVQAGRDPLLFDGILIRSNPPLGRTEVLWQHPGLHVLPVFDLTGALGHKADLDLSRLASTATGRVGDMVTAFNDKRSRLHRDLARAEDPGEKLIAHLYLSGNELDPVYDANSLLLFAYPVPLANAEIVRLAERLASEGLLKKRFVDRVHQCGSCESAHLNVREECPSCGSPQLVEQPYIHHFSCAYQGPEEDFRSGDDLVCPKCRKTLRHFGQDYDRPGSMLVCQACGHATSEPDVGFVCASCHTHTSGESMGTKDIFSYALTDKGLAFAESGRAVLGLQRTGLRFADLPLELVVALNDQARRYNEDGTPFALVDIAYRNQHLVEREEGARMFVRARNQFLENLHQAMPPNTRIAAGQSYDFALVPEMTAQSLKTQTESLAATAAGAISVDLGAVLTVFSPQDLF